MVLRYDWIEDIPNIFRNFLKITSQQRTFHSLIIRTTCDHALIKLFIEFRCRCGKWRFADNKAAIGHIWQFAKTLTSALNHGRTTKNAERNITSNLSAKLSQCQNRQRIAIMTV